MQQYMVERRLFISELQFRLKIKRSLSSHNHNEGSTVKDQENTNLEMIHESESNLTKLL